MSSLTGRNGLDDIPNYPHIVLPGQGAKKEISFISLLANLNNLKARPVRTISR